MRVMAALMVLGALGCGAKSELKIGNTERPRDTGRGDAATDADADASGLSDSGRDGDIVCVPGSVEICDDRRVLDLGEGDEADLLLGREGA